MPHRLLFRFSAFLVCLLVAGRAAASHSLGGELTYQVVDQVTYRYKIKARIYRDCLHGDPQAVAQDLPMKLVIFKGDGSVYLKDQLTPTQTGFLPASRIGGSCYNDTARWCVSYAESEITVTLPPNPSGYYAVYDRCCMVEDVTNITGPESKGLRLKVYIPVEPVTLNKGAVFAKPATLRVCGGERFALDCSAQNPDGDSLFYTLAAVESSEGSAGTPLPEPSMVVTPEALFATGYLPRTPFGALAPVQLDSATGMLRGQVRRPGAYLLKVQVYQIHNGVPVTGPYRVFILEVADCHKAAQAIIEPDSLTQLSGIPDAVASLCASSRTVVFQNASVGGERYAWDFGVANSTTDTSSERNPAYTFPGSGRYLVTLVVSGAGCTDTATGLVLLSDDQVTADFGIQTLTPFCVQSAAIFSDRSTTTGSSIPYQRWVFYQNGTLISTAEGGQVRYAWQAPGRQRVAHIVASATGCVSGTAQDVVVEAGDIRLSLADTILIPGAQAYVVANGAAVFTWTSTPLGLLLSGNPNGPVQQLNTANPLKKGVIMAFAYGSNGCLGSDTATIIVASKSYVFVPTAFTPNGDGVNDVIGPTLAGGNLESFSVFSRSGQRFFYTNDLHSTWDGTFQGAALPTGTFLWQALVRDASGVRTVEKGDLLLLR